MIATYINFKGICFVVQSYKKDEFVNLCDTRPSPDGISSVRIDFAKNNLIETWGKRSQKWSEFTSSITAADINRLKTVLNELP